MPKYLLDCTQQMTASPNAIGNKVHVDSLPTAKQKDFLALNCNDSWSPEATQVSSILCKPMTDGGVIA